MAGMLALSCANVMLNSQNHIQNMFQGKMYLFHIHGEGAFGLAFRTGSDLDLSLSILVERPKNGSTLGAVVFHFLQLRKDSRASRDDT